MGIIANKTFASMNELGPIIEESLKYKSDVRITIKGNSMYPLLRSEIDSVRLTNVKKVRRFAMVLYRRESGQYVLHRILKCKGDLLGIAGDNEIRLEYPVKKSQIIAQVSGFWKGDKYFSCKNPLYRLYVLFWAAIFPKRRKAIPVLQKLRRKLK